MAVNDTILALGPLGFWLTNAPDDATAAHDAGAGAHDGTFYGTHSVGRASVTADGATSATFATDGALTPDLSAPYNPSGDFSLAFWFASTATGISIAAGLYGGQSSYWAGLNNNKASFSYAFNLSLDSPADCNDGQPHFVAACRSGDSYNLYVDGALVNTATLANQTYIESSAFAIGNFAKDAPANAYGFTGRLAKVAYFDKALSPADVSAVWAAGSTGGGGGGGGTAALVTPEGDEMSYLGDFGVGQIVVLAPGTGGTLASGAAAVYRDGSAKSTAGVAVAADVDGKTGFNVVTVDTGADPTFYVDNHDYKVVFTAGTVGGNSVVGQVVGSFSIRNRPAEVKSVAFDTSGIKSVGG